MNKLTTQKRSAVIAALVEGCSIRATVRMTGVAKNTVVKLLRGMGAVCDALHDQTVRGLKPRRIECDELWSFVWCKEKNVPTAEAAPADAGDAWTWVAIDPETKLVVSYLIGRRTHDDARALMLDLAGRVTNIIQLTTDGFQGYPQAVWDAFEDKVHFAQLIKQYAAEPANEARYSPPTCTGCIKRPVIGFPHKPTVSTSIVERNNLTMRMGMRRFTRLTNGFSKKAENLAFAVALHFAHYNFCRVHQTLRVTPAMAAGLTDHVWELSELVGLLEQAESN